MKYILTAALALALAGASAASAQADPPVTPDKPDHHADHKPVGPPVGGDHGAPHVGDHGGAKPGFHPGGPNGGYHPGGRSDSVHVGVNSFGGVTVGVHVPGLGFQVHGYRGRDQGRVVFHSGLFQPEYAAPRHFHTVWVAPGGWYAHSWRYGETLPIGWYAPNYYLGWNDYGLPAPPVGCEWVRQGPDAVLVDVWSGQVLSVYRGAFD